MVPFVYSGAFSSLCAFPRNNSLFPSEQEAALCRRATLLFVEEKGFLREKEKDSLAFLAGDERHGTAGAFGPFWLFLPHLQGVRPAISFFRQVFFVLVDGGRNARHVGTVNRSGCWKSRP